MHSCAHMVGEALSVQGSVFSLSLTSASCVVIQAKKLCAPLRLCMIPSGAHGPSTLVTDLTASTYGHTGSRLGTDFWLVCRPSWLLDRTCLCDADLQLAAGRGGSVKPSEPLLRMCWVCTDVNVGRSQSRANNCIV